MKLNETLFASFKRIAALRQVAKILRQSTGRQPLGYGAKLRMRRMEWIKNSQEQGIEVANDRREARKADKEQNTHTHMAAHLTRYYPMHRHDRRATA